MAIAPNTTFVSGAILTAAQQNAFGFGVCALATSTANYTLTVAPAQATGMTLSFTAIANRNYKITYYEPQVSTSSVSGGFVTATIRPTSAATASIQSAIIQTVAAGAMNGTFCVTYIGTFTAGSTTIVGCLSSSSITGAPLATRSATAPAFLLVEDIGPA
jgi:hypothetical protein